jgi:acyl-coenzyme A synthetase/AMP-(fatty) acid ligase
MVKIAGKRCSLADLNRKLSAIAGVDDGVIFMPPGESVRLAALVVAPRLRCGAILEALKPLVDPVFLPRPVFLVERLPRQETGKLAQSAVLELFERTRNDIAQGDNLRLDRQRELTRSKET